MRYFIIFLIVLSCISCKNNTSKEAETDNSDNKESSDAPSGSIETYNNEEWGFSLKFPKEFILLESELPGKSPVINLYLKNNNFNPPFAIHEDPENAYIAVLPQGFGVDAPNGGHISFENTSETVNLSSDLKLDNSKAYVLESGESWAYFLRFKDPPENWKEYGGVFVHFPIQNFEAKCVDKAGNQKDLENCDPMGEDKIKYYGKVETDIKSRMINILEFFQFQSNYQKPISDLIKIEKPLPNMDVTSPLTTKGKARGYWFFEANAPIEIQDKDYNTLAESYIKAEGKWMTEDFVDFSGKIEFESLDDERGYLVFKRANPSAKKENDRIYRLPIIFPPEK
ncbi:Gmad2 immunoglobulin-like domain-containing protein [Gramella sp. MAR_2010_147]|uniref:Gmad2 immunoglobulin-like domain-containing protein n=1 Tax=Gramella sp. MAR_2010_147 TaxID=1250205 RepID=UPI00087C5031|nr:Gmad2 immunoglobulin-like domain-containing protein [Gramella sp. MAR_2010_147]SDS04120.1 Immunoglobulin-like domain of spore germination [Gramella sp. MAR_2010_147]